MVPPIKYAFFGTPQLAVYAVEELVRAGHTPTLVVTAPDEPAGRRLTLTAPPVKTWALGHEVPVLQVASLKNRMEVPELANSEWDVSVVAAYNIILPQWVLELPRRGVLNVHPSLLPKFRGPSPIRSAILADAKYDIGVSIIQLDEQVDHGPILAQASVALEDWPVRGRVLDELLFREGGRLLAEALVPWMRGEIEAGAQDHEHATYTRKFTKEDGLLDVNGDPYTNYLKWCAYDGWPGIFYFDANHKRVKITDAEYRDGAFHILKVVPEGKKEMHYEDYCRGGRRS